jgi:hypothetical protein
LTLSLNALLFAALQLLDADPWSRELLWHRTALLNNHLTHGGSCLMMHPIGFFFSRTAKPA